MLSNKKTIDLGETIVHKPIDNADIIQETKAINPIKKDNNDKKNIDLDTTIVNKDDFFDDFFDE